MGFHCPTRIGLLPALDSRHPWRTGKGWPCAHEEHERGGNTMLKAAEDEALTLLILLHDPCRKRIHKAKPCDDLRLSENSTFCVLYDTMQDNEFKRRSLCLYYYRMIKKISSETSNFFSLFDLYPRKTRALNSPIPAPIPANPPFSLFSDKKPPPSKMIVE